jgi:hypothetical protein
MPTGQRGLARHREAAHGVAPMVAKRGRHAADVEIAEMLRAAGGDKALVTAALDRAERVAPGTEYEALRAALARA